MKATQILQYGRNPKVCDYAKPLPQPGQLLIKVLYAPIHPADVYFYKGIYGVRKILPSPVGFEGVGIIESADDKKIKGQIVSFMPSKISQFGSWSQYCVVDQSDTILVNGDQRDLKLLQKSSCAFINPFTSMGFLSFQSNLAKNGGYKNILFSTCQSQVSRMSLRVLNHFYPESKLYALSRQVNENHGLEYVKNFALIDGVEDMLKNQFDGPVLYFDSLGGPTSGKILNSLPQNSKLISYGSSSMTHISHINPQDLIFQGKTIQGFWMNQFYDNLQQSERNEIKFTIQRELTNGSIFDSSIASIYKLQNIQEALDAQKNIKGIGKIIIQCQCEI